MAFFLETLGKVKSLFEDGKVKEAKQKMVDALNSITADSLVTAEEVDQINKLQKDLGLSDQDLNNLKIKVLENLMEKISADGTITPEEIKVFNEIKAGLGVDMKIELEDDADKEFMKEKMTEVKNFLFKMKDKGVELAGKAIDKSKEMKDKLMQGHEKGKTVEPPAEK